MSINRLKSKISNLPKSPGVYEFYDKKGKILYIGKATNLRDRMRSYFARNLDPRIARMVADIADIKIHKTDSVLEALIFEANLIKKHQPKYNIEGKDDKSFVYVVITRASKQSLVRGFAPEEFPKVLILRETDLYKTQKSKRKSQSYNSRVKSKKIPTTNYQLLTTSYQSRGL